MWMGYCGVWIIFNANRDGELKMSESRAAQDSGMANKIAVSYLDEHDVLHPLGLQREDENNWPSGFMDELWRIEVAIKLAYEGKANV
jgi:hypothetical protein